MLLNTEFMVGSWEFPRTSAPRTEAGPHFYHFMSDETYSWEYDPIGTGRILTRPKPFRWEGDILVLMRGLGESRVPVEIEPDGSLCATDPFGQRWYMRRLSKPKEPMIAFVTPEGKLQRLEAA